MRDPRRLVDQNDNAALKRLLVAGRHDGPPVPSGAKQRVQVAVIAHMRAEAEEVNRSGIRVIGIATRQKMSESNRDKPRSISLEMPNRSWVDQVFTWFAAAAVCAAIVFVVRHAYFRYAENTQPRMTPRNVHAPKSNMDDPPAAKIAEEDEWVDEHRAAITVTEEPTAIDENDEVDPEPLRAMRQDMVLPLKHRANTSVTPRIVLHSWCGNPKEWLMNSELDYPTEAYKAAVEGTMNVTCNLTAEGSFAGCTAQRPQGFSAGDVGRVLMAMNTWTLGQSLADWSPRGRRCKIDVVFDLRK